MVTPEDFPGFQTIFQPGKDTKQEPCKQFARGGDAKTGLFILCLTRLTAEDAKTGLFVMLREDAKTGLFIMYLPLKVAATVTFDMRGEHHDQTPRQAACLSSPLPMQARLMFGAPGVLTLLLL
jgi:hypothetical protein